MYYIKGTHRQFGNVIWLEAFDGATVKIVRHIFGRNYPEYNWQPIDANSNKIIPAKMRKMLNIA